MAAIRIARSNILAVGRAVDKKGFDDLLEALRANSRPAGTGDSRTSRAGPCCAELKQQARRLWHRRARIEWRGAQAQAAVSPPTGRRTSSLPCRVSGDGDRDGLPNVLLLEAQSQKLPCVSTRVSGIPELIEHEVTGLLVEPRAIGALAQALSRLIADPAQRRRLSAAGFATSDGCLFARGRRRSSCRTVRNLRQRTMRVAFYAPLKPADHPCPPATGSWDSPSFRALRAAGHDPFVASKFRSFDGRGDAGRQARLALIGQRMAARLVRRLARPAIRPDVWLTYHLYHKAPDWLGPAVSHALDIPYVIAEASAAPKQRDGKWATGYAASVSAIESAAATIFFNPVDVPGVRNLRGPARGDECVPPFVDVASFAALPAAAAVDVPERGKGLRLVTVAMMRPGAKLASLPTSCRRVGRVASKDWELVIVGDGSARAEVDDAFARFDSSQIRRVGFQDAARVALPGCGPATSSSGLRSTRPLAWRSSRPRPAGSP